MAGYPEKRIESILYTLGLTLRHFFCALHPAAKDVVLKMSQGE
jgi:hypothetical protein